MLDTERNIYSPLEVKKIGLKDYERQIVLLIESVKLSPEYIKKADVWLGCVTEDKLVGCMALERRNGLVHIQSLSVEKEHRRNGIARSLVDSGFENYLVQGDIMVALTLFWNIKVYERMGFHRVNAAEMKKRDDVAGREKHKYCVALVREK
ncbi:MAG: hypothetical protein UX13_C0042G0005 [Candidatus Woesebacteria bacterium GW2011_GWB1_45_5]|uniref:N-acetyltransferase domain-containing protein n=1 Tax=Candidatus Woesebacteria bacterium GW2011_GWB1_45_5 TaxID=1618581 RepID=A0A0G1MMF4_9BACT|nr:MAG: hypothetical protein UX13_C0042G0005 [Candidatus Woesebacteria bacterium GW2011_GWB1_45_5]